MNAVCKMSKEQTIWPCSARACPLFWDCYLEYEKAVAKPFTIGDRIRAMTDEELAEKFYELYMMSAEWTGGEITTLWCDGKAGCIDEHGDIDCNEERHKACILRWLKSEAKPNAE